MYLSGNGKNFGFKHEKVNAIENEDVEISDVIYQKFFYEQENGRRFIIKNKNGNSFEEIFEETFIENEVI